MKRVLLFLPLAAALGLGGCVATQQDMLDLESQTDSLKQQVAQLDKTISSLQANQADLSVRMQSLHEDLSSYTETIKENQDQMTRLSSKLDDLSAGVESRVAQIGATLSSQQLKSLEQQRAAAEQAAKAAAESTAPSDLFNTADVRLNVKDYDLAAKGFEEYLRKYPHGALVDVATYKLGQAYFRQGRWESAGRRFAAVIEKYPKSEMLPSSRLYYALCLLRMKRHLSEAKKYLESITLDFPRSPEAKAAAAQLKRLSRSRKS